MRSILLSTLLIFLSGALSGCLQANKSRMPSSSAATTSSPSYSAANVSLLPAPPNLEIIQVRVVSGTGSNTKTEFEISFKGAATSSNLSYNAIGSFCRPGTDLACLCRLKWDESNTTTWPPGASVSADPLVVNFTRTAYSTVSLASNGEVALCEVPSVYTSEIGVNQSMKIDVVPIVGHKAPFTTTVWTLVKPGAVLDPQQASFLDMSGNKFRNIERYVCHEKIKRGAGVSSATASAKSKPPQDSVVHQTPIEEDVNYIYASWFNVTMAGTADSNRRLATQQNYFSLYFPFSRPGMLNAENNAYYCPQVPRVSTAPADFFPRDSSFALATQRSKDFQVPVEARNRLSKTSQDRHEPCKDSNSGLSTSGSLGNNNMVISCLGFAARPRADGSCGTIKVKNPITQTEEIKRMYRLRRFNVLYPTMYDSNGDWINGYQNKNDQVLVLDRPAKINNSGVNVDVTIYGPKPCPFAWYDQYGVTGSVGYKGTNNTGWTGKNPDGLFLPTAPRNQSGSACPAIVPYKLLGVDGRPTLQLRTLTSNDRSPDIDQGALKVETRSSPTNYAAIRPIQAAWEPLYLEDFEFEACAPDSHQATFRAPIHQAQPASEASYCEEIYPTKISGGASTAHADVYQTQTASSSESHQGHPLLAPEADINQALQKKSVLVNGFTIPPTQTLIYGCRVSTPPGTPTTNEWAESKYPTACCAESGAHRTSCSPPTP